MFNYLVGSMTRIFTTLKEVDDSLILYGYVAGFILNSILVAQMVTSKSINDASLRRILTRASGVLLEQSSNSIPCWRNGRKARKNRHGLHHRRDTEIKGSNDTP